MKRFTRLHKVLGATVLTAVVGVAGLTGLTIAGAGGRPSLPPGPPPVPPSGAFAPPDVPSLPSGTTIRVKPDYYQLGLQLGLTPEKARAFAERSERINDAMANNPANDIKAGPDEPPAGRR